jgi:hypothetical protein
VFALTVSVKVFVPVAPAKVHMLRGALPTVAETVLVAVEAFGATPYVLPTTPSLVASGGAVSVNSGRTVSCDMRVTNLAVLSVIVTMAPALTPAAAGVPVTAQAVAPIFTPLGTVVDAMATVRFAGRPALLHVKGPFPPLKTM